ncbi:MAG: hypothetical protein H7144_02435 [Burkholderiales bacterium]|nr:hypothetical protein [Phycisphaerae bacterium]
MADSFSGELPVMRSVLLTIFCGLMLSAAARPVVADAGDDARRAVSQAQAEFGRIAGRTHANNPLAGDIRRSQVQVTKAYKRLDEVRREIADGVSARPEIRQLNLQIRAADDRLAVAASPTTRLAIANELLQLRKQRTTIYAAACSGNIHLTIAQADLQDAVNRLRGAEMEYATTVNADPEFDSARQRLAAVRRSVPRLSYALGG